MKKILFVITLIICLLTVTVKATDDKCTTEMQAELNKIAAQVKAEYSFTYDEKDNSVSGFDITVYNLSKEIYITYQIQDKRDENVKVISGMEGSDKDNTYTFHVDNTDEIYTYLFTVSSLEYTTGCSKVLRNFKLVKPKYNKFCELSDCKYNEMVDYIYCKKWITRDFTLDDDGIIKNINKKRKSVVTTTTTKVTHQVAAKSEETEQTELYIAGLLFIIFLIIVIMIVVLIKINKDKKYEI